MSVTCPACNKANQSDALCSRCGCDLSQLHKVVQACAAALSSAQDALRRRDWPQALEWAERSWRFCHTIEAAQLAFAAAAASGETAQALRWRERSSAIHEPIEGSISERGDRHKKAYISKVV